MRDARLHGRSIVWIGGAQYVDGTRDLDAVSAEVEAQFLPFLPAWRY